MAEIRVWAGHKSQRVCSCVLVQAHVCTVYASVHTCVCMSMYAAYKEMQI